jgi:cytochrome c-type biogenesis protein CcmH/NrfG
MIEKSSGHADDVADTLEQRALSEGPKGHVMRRFVAGLLLGLASMYWYAYQKDAFLQVASDWFASASADPNAKEKMDKMISRKN